jgi:hypothetical protein
VATRVKGIDIAKARPIDFVFFILILFGEGDSYLVTYGLHIEWSESASKKWVRKRTRR